MENQKKINYPGRRMSYFDAHRDEVKSLCREGKKIKEIYRIISEKMPHKLSYQGFWKWFKKANLCTEEG